MPNPRLAVRYAKSLVDLAVEKNQLEAINDDMRYLQAVCAQSKEFVQVLRSPIIKGDAKDKILSAVTNGKVSETTKLFNELLVRKGREENLPEIINAFITQYNVLKQIHKVKLTTATPASEELKQTIMAKIKAETPMQNVELETAVDEKLLGGFVLEVAGKMVDASILRDLNDVKKQFMNNDYIYKVR